MGFETVNYTVSERVATVTLNRPEQGNALNEQMHRELNEIWHEVNRDDDVWAVVVRGAGQDFCLGEDAAEIHAAYQQGTKVERWQLDEAWQRKSAGHAPRFGWPEPTQGLPGKPLMSVVQGRCQGSGMLFAAFADFTLAADTAEFSLPNVHQGTAPILETLTMARTMLRTPVLHLALGGKYAKWSADRARQLGMVFDVVPEEKLDERLAEVLDLLVGRSAALAVRAARTGWWGSFPYPPGSGPLGAGYRTHYPYMAEVRVVSQDAKEGPRAFAEKRRPQWKAK